MSRFLEFWMLLFIHPSRAAWPSIISNSQLPFPGSRILIIYLIIYYSAGPAGTHLFTNHSQYKPTWIHLLIYSGHGLVPARCLFIVASQGSAFCYLFIRPSAFLLHSVTQLSIIRQIRCVVAAYSFILCWIHCILALIYLGFAGSTAIQHLIICPPLRPIHCSP